MKNKGWIYALIGLCVLCVVLLIAFLVYALNGGSKFFFGRGSYQLSDTIIHDEVYEEEFRRIQIKSGASQVEVVSSSDEKVHVMIYGQQELKEVSQNDDVLEIKMNPRKCIGFCFFEDIARIVVSIPTEFDQELTIENQYGDVKIGEFLQANILVDEDCGNVEVKGARRIDIQNNYGDIFVESSMDAIIKASAGNIYLESTTNATIKNSFGGIKIDQVLGSMDIENNCGDIEIMDATILENSKIAADLGAIRIKKINDIYIDASADLGNVTVEKNHQESNVTLKIHNDCGDIQIGK